MAGKEFLDLLIKSQDKIFERLSAIEQRQSADAEVLKDHTRRSMANEEAILIQREATKSSNAEIIAAIQPLQKHVTQVETVLKILGLAGSGIVGLAGLTWTIMEIIKRI